MTRSIVRMSAGLPRSRREASRYLLAEAKDGVSSRYGRFKRIN